MKMEKHRDEKMEEIREKFREMHQYCLLVTKGREEAEGSDWRSYLLKNRLHRRTEAAKKSILDEEKARDEAKKAKLR